MPALNCLFLLNFILFLFLCLAFLPQPLLEGKSPFSSQTCTLPPWFWGGVRASLAPSCRQVAAKKDHTTSQQPGCSRCTCCHWLVSSFVMCPSVHGRFWASHQGLELCVGNTLHFLWPFSICCDGCSVTCIIIGNIKPQNKMPEWLCILT